MGYNFSMTTTKRTADIKATLNTIDAEVHTQWMPSDQSFLSTVRPFEAEEVLRAWERLHQAGYNIELLADGRTMTV